MGLKRDGNLKASRWCAGCHDVVPFFSGAFDDPNFDDVKHPTSQAGMTCTVIVAAPSRGWAIASLIRSAVAQPAPAAAEESDQWPPTRRNH